MANVIMQTGNLSVAMREIYSTVLIESARENMIFNQIAEVWNDPAVAHGEKMYKTIYKQHKATPGELSETVDPDSTPMSAYNIDVTVREHGDAIQLSEKIRRLSYQPVVGRRVADVGYGMGITMDTMAFWALMEGTNKWYANSKSARTDLTEGDSITSSVIRTMTRNLRRRNARPLGGGGTAGHWLAFISPDVHFDMTADTDWVDPHKYVDTSALYQNELGMWYGVRFIESTVANLVNFGVSSVDATLLADVAKLATTLTSIAASSFSVGDVITVGEPKISDITDGSFDPSREEITIGSIVDSTITLKSDTFMQFAHSATDKLTLAKDIHPIIMVGEGPFARAQALSPELRVQTPVDKLQRLNSVGWYGIFGFGIARDWQIEIVECCPSA